MKHLSKTIGAVLIVLVVAGFAGAFQFGKSIGFKTGSQWALVQADILAREAGLFMPVSLRDENFHLVIKQPRGIYKKAWQLADQYDEAKNNLKAVKMEAPTASEQRPEQTTF